MSIEVITVANTFVLALKGVGVTNNRIQNRANQYHHAKTELLHVNLSTNKCIKTVQAVPGHIKLCTGSIHSMHITIDNSNHLFVVKYLLRAKVGNSAH